MASKTLLNVVYKIALEWIANWIKSLLDILINKDKTSLTIGRFIGENMTHIWFYVLYLST